MAERLRRRFLPVGIAPVFALAATAGAHAFEPQTAVPVAPTEVIAPADGTAHLPKAAPSDTADRLTATTPPARLDQLKSRAPSVAGDRLRATPAPFVGAGGEPATVLAPEPPPVAGPRTRAGRSWPAPGDVVARFGDARPGFKLPGIRIEARSAAPVHAPADGRVIFADYVDEVGLVLIIAHDNKYHSVLAGLGRVDAAVGTRVQAGRKVGRMLEGDSTTPLHLELHRDGRPVDPLPWLGVRLAGDRHS